jgi:3-hydroxy-D-aspartate aldolase
VISTRHQEQIGRPKAEVTTPALLLDLDAARRNSATMSARFRQLPARLRPHIKVHKCPALARMEVANGAVGVACATVWEAEAMATQGIADVLIANQVVSPDKVRRLAELARDHRITVCVDDARNIDALDSAVRAAGSRLEVLIEVDVGMGRGGVRELDDAVKLADMVARAGQLQLRGLQGYEGHCIGEIDVAVRRTRVAEANGRLISAADHLARHGHECQVLSGGGTGSYFITGANPRINEVQAGSYLLMDVFHERLIPGEFEAALTVLGTVVSEHDSSVVLDVGRKSISNEFVTPRLAHEPTATPRYFSEEHSVINFPDRPPVRLGETVEIIPSYAPTTVNLHDVYHVVESGVVTDIWPIEGRGS